MKTEYLLIKRKDDFCNTNDQFINHLLTNTRITVNGNTICFSNKELTYSLSVSEVHTKGNKETLFYFIISVSNEDEESALLLESFDDLLHRICDEQFDINTIWDDTSIFYAKRLYPQIIEVENLLRKIIYRFMMKTAGKDWFKGYVPKEVKESVGRVQEKNNPRKTDSDQLSYADFIQLGYLFFNRYTLKPFTIECMQELKRLVSEDDKPMDKEKVRLFLENYEGKSNWDRYFSEKIDVDKLEEKWGKLYKYRNQVAHTRRMRKAEYEDAVSIIGELKPAFHSCLEKIDSIQLTEEQSEAAQEYARETVAKSQRENLSAMLSVTNSLSSYLSQNDFGMNIAGIADMLSQYSAKMRDPLEGYRFDTGIIQDMLRDTLSSSEHFRELVSPVSSATEQIKEVFQNDNTLASVISETSLLSGSTTAHLAELVESIPRLPSDTMEDGEDEDNKATIV